MTSQISIPSLDEPLRLMRFEEPQLEFGHGQSTADPRDGLTLFGPLETKRREVRVGVIGRAEGVARYHAWAETIRHPIVPSPEVQDVRRVMYPGFEAVFGAVWDPGQSHHFLSRAGRFQPPAPSSDSAGMGRHTKPSRAENGSRPNGLRGVPE